MPLYAYISHGEVQSLAELDEDNVPDSWVEVPKGKKVEPGMKYTPDGEFVPKEAPGNG